MNGVHEILSATTITLQQIFKRKTKNTAIWGDTKGGEGGVGGRNL